MAERASASQRVYEQLKADILSGAIAYGRVEIQPLADRLKVSQTPVREALARLAAEHLVENGRGPGYQLAPPSAQALRDLYGWSGQLVHLAFGAVSGPLAARAADAIAPAWRGVECTDANRYAHIVSGLLIDIAQAQPNQELATMLSNANDRLFCARACEPALFADALEQAEAMRALWRAGELAPLPEQLSAFHQARTARAEQIAAQVAARLRARATG